MDLTIDTVPNIDSDLNCKDECNLIKLQIDKHLNEITEYTKYIKSAKTEINNLYKQLYSVCEHDFRRDNSAAHDDIFKYKCTKCNLYQNYYY